jgi:hypothetical protein
LKGETIIKVYHLDTQESTTAAARRTYYAKPDSPAELADLKATAEAILRHHGIDEALGNGSELGYDAAPQVVYSCRKFYKYTADIYRSPNGYVARVSIIGADLREAPYQH